MPRGKKVSEDLAWTVIRLLPLFSIHEVCAFTNISVRQIRTIQSLYSTTGDPVSHAAGRKRRRKHVLTIGQVNFLHNTIDPNNDTYLDQEDLKQVYGIEISKSAVWRALQHSGYTMKKMTRTAMERSSDKRADYIARVGPYTREQLVFVDESAADRRTTYCGHVWAVSGRRAVHKAFFVRGKKYSILPALSLCGIMYVDIVEGSFNTAKFASFISGLLDQMNPYPQPNSVIIMDNRSIHKCPEVLDMIIERGMRYEFLPPYSPDYNPIELAFSFIKGYIRRHGDIVTGSDEMVVYQKLHEAVWAVSPEQVEGWFYKCGY